MTIPLQHLWLFPFIAGTSWLITLLTLLITWLARGRPRYPDQSNPYVAFISDIGAFELKPVFLIGGIITAISFIGTTCSVHFARYSPHIYGLKDSPPTKAVSWLAVFSSVVAGLCLILLGILDTYRFHESHAIILSGCFMALGVSAVCTTFVYFDQTRKTSSFRRLRVYCVISTVIVFSEVCLGSAFLVLLHKEWYRVAGFLEWTVTILGAFWLLCFMGYVTVPEEGIDIRERERLLGDSAYIYSEPS